MCESFKHPFCHHPMMTTCCCSHWSWHEPSKEEKLSWLKSCKEELEKELAEIQKQIDQMEQQN